MGRRTTIWITALVPLIAACETASQHGDGGAPIGGAGTTTIATAHATTTSTPTSTASSTTTSTTTASTTTTTTTTTLPPLDVYDAHCVVEVESGDSLQLIADRFDDETVSGASVRAENGLADDVSSRVSSSTCASTTV